MKPGYFPLYTITVTVIAPDALTDDDVRRLDDQVGEIEVNMRAAIMAILAEIDPRLELGN